MRLTVTSSTPQGLNARWSCSTTARASGMNIKVWVQMMQSKASRGSDRGIRQVADQRRAGLEASMSTTSTVPTSRPTAACSRRYHPEDASSNVPVARGRNRCSSGRSAYHGVAEVAASRDKPAAVPRSPPDAPGRRAAARPRGPTTRLSITRITTGQDRGSARESARANRPAPSPNAAGASGRGAAADRCAGRTSTVWYNRV